MIPPDDERVLDLLVEWEEARQQGAPRSVEELCPHDPKLQQALRRRIDQRQRVARMIEPEPTGDPHDLSREAVAVAARELAKLSEMTETLPTHIGRYRREKLLGRGGFGLVYLAHDEQLNRRVAIKVPHPLLVSRPEEAEAYRTEARAVASLDHPHIVPVFDVGSTEKCACFVVSKYIEGTSLAQRLKQSRPTFRDTAALLATVAEALHYAHKQGFVHRDVKPANILLSQSGEPFVIDFGLALREQALSDGRRFAGTPTYMSPEQARGEAHRVDGRSDIFSLGVVLYEMLTGRRPFQSDDDRELLSQVVSTDPKPPRQIDDRVPKELERICLKSLAKRVTERYTTAKDFAADLRFYLSEQTPVDSERPTSPHLSPAPPPSTASSRTGSSEVEAASFKIVPKGLRSFDEQDADFFLELLPGPRDRDGLPESIRLWKTRIEERDADKTFSVGLLYGPSGSGKSSLIKAGLLPRMSGDIVTVYLEATPNDTEARLLNGLRRRCPSLSKDLPLKEILAALRRGMVGGATQKVLIILDQFEQWLHANHELPDTELVAALRQCDGEHVQCVVMVRDDFWMAATRFMRELELPLIEGFNSNPVDLFPVRHARKVLMAFGRAFGALPPNIEQTTPEQHEFVKQAIASLAQEGHVISVRLALFAEMLKERPWVPATLKAVGGTEGVGVTFLEATFSGSNAPPSHRLHQRAARAVLAMMLPDAGIDIKGHVRSYSELLAASGYANRLQDLGDLIRILDNEVRLITPTEGDASNATERAVSDAAEAGAVVACPDGSNSPLATHHSPLTSPLPATLHYQLTHDYLVPALRGWLTRKQRETRRGRAELLLVERSALWNSKPDNRMLPTLIEFMGIRWWTSRSRWSEPQRLMMSRAGRVHFARCGGLSVFVFAIAFAVQQTVFHRHQERVKAAIDAVQNNLVPAVPEALRELKSLPRQMTIGEIRARSSTVDAGQRLRLAFADAELGNADVDFLCSQIGTTAWEDVDHLVTALRHNRDEALTMIRAEAAKYHQKSNWKMKARLAIVALYLSDQHIAADMCQIADRPDPVQRTWFIEQFAFWQGDIIKLAALSRGMEDAALRSALCLGLAVIPAERVTNQAKDAWHPLFIGWFHTAPDALTHSAAGLPCLYWKLEIPQIETSRQPDGRRDWFVNTFQMTLIRILPHPSQPKDTDHPRELYLSDREITQKPFSLFMEDPDYPADQKPSGLPPIDWSIPFLPMHSVNWFDAVMFCNWLNQREGLQPCYEKTGTKHDCGWDDWRLIPGRDGYRLPSEAHWQIACAAETETKYSFGNGEFFFRYANIGGTGMYPGAVKMPNGWGLFDMHGNVAEWCNHCDPGYTEIGRVVKDAGFLSNIEQASTRARFSRNPSHRLIDLGFRVAFIPPVKDGQ